MTMLLQQKMFYGHLETLVLLVLAEEPLHPYRLRQVLAERSGDYFCPALGRLYPLLQTLEKRHRVRSKLVPGRGEQLRRRYTITAAGRRAVANRLDHWRSFSKAMAAVLDTASGCGASEQGQL